MQLADFDFNLPEALIAQHPPVVRGSSRLLAALPDTAMADKMFADLPDWVQPGDVLVFNNTKVMKARLFGQKESGGKIEALIERVVDAHTALAHVRSSKSPKPGTQLVFEGGIEATMLERQGELFCLHFAGRESVYELLARHGHLPLPPYIERAADDEDDSRYQTVYAKHQGAVAAPTAGLHFTDELLAQLKAKGVHMAEVTLHVGAGTFQPVKTENLAEHHMHSEWYEVPAATQQAIADCHARGGRVVAAGTTTVRTLESWAQSGVASGDTHIFITPGFEFKVVDVLVTNFHLPKSTLMMLVSAFAGYDQVMALYRHAIAQEYRFFSYGDAMLLERGAPTARL